MNTHFTSEYVPPRSVTALAAKVRSKPESTVAPVVSRTPPVRSGPRRITRTALRTMESGSPTLDNCSLNLRRARLARSRAGSSAYDAVSSPVRSISRSASESYEPEEKVAVEVGVAAHIGPKEPAENAGHELPRRHVVPNVLRISGWPCA